MRRAANGKHWTLLWQFGKCRLSIGLICAESLPDTERFTTPELWYIQGWEQVNEETLVTTVVT